MLKKVKITVYQKGLIQGRTDYFSNNFLPDCGNDCTRRIDFIYLEFPNQVSFSATVDHLRSC